MGQRAVNATSVTTDEKLNAVKVEAEAIRLWLKSPLTLVATVVLHAASVGALWNEVSHGKLVLWATAGSGWCAIRFGVWLYYRRGAWTDIETLRWGRLFAAMLGITGLIIAIAAPLAYAPSNPDDRMFLVMAIGGIAAGATGIYGVYYPAVVVFTTPLLGTLAAVFFAQNTPNGRFLGFMTLVYLSLLLTSARILKHWVWDIFSLRIRNDQLTVQLIEARDAAEAANEAKSVIMANMSHELRTPLNAIIGFAEMLEKEVLGPLGSPRYVDYARDVRMSGIHLLSLINTILDLAKTHAAGLELNLAVFDIRQLLGECVSVMRLQADKAGLDLALNLPQDPLFARADDTRLRQVLYNLLSNAIKFTDRGGRITVTGRISPPGKVEIWVVDTGIGMDAEEVAVALQPFMQVKQTGGRITAGTGLGLPFAKTIVELHGGRFDIVSIKGRGTTIKLTLPAG